MSNKKTYHKYTATTMAAAAAVASVAPVVASADTAEFSDVSKDNAHYDNIMKLAEQEVIKGYSDGSFGPWDPVSRGQVAVMLTQALDLEIPNNIESVLEDYSDVNPGDRYAEEVAAVTASGIFKGTGDGKFNRYSNITRQQMATALVKGFNLKEYDTGEDVEIDRSNISDSHEENVQVLANLGITVKPMDFNAYEDISRAAFSTFLVKTMEITEEIVVTSVNAVEGQTVDNSTDKQQYLDFTINNNKEVTIEELKEAGYTIEFLTSKDVLNDDKDAQPNELSQEKLVKAGNSFTYQVRISQDGEEVALSDHVTVEVEDFSKALTEVTKVVPEVDGQEKRSNVVTEGEELSFNVYGHLKNNPDKEVDVTHLVDSVESSKLTVLYIYNDFTAKAIKSGEATVTVKVGDKEATQEITVVDSEDAPAIDSLSVDVESVNLVKGNSETIQVTVKDQYGDALKGERVTPSMDENIAKLDKTSGVTDKNGIAEFTLTGDTEGTATLTLTVGEETIEIPVEVIEAGEVDHYNLKGEGQFDLADGATQNYTLQGYDENDLESGEAVELPTSGDKYYEVESSDENVAEVAIEDNEVVVTGQKAGTVTVTLAKYEGTLATPSETFTKEIEIEDSRAKLTEATIAEKDALPEFTSETLTADLSEIVTELTFLPDTTAYEFVQGDDNNTVINIVDTNEEVENDVLGTVEISTVKSDGIDATIAPKEDRQDATITVSHENNDVNIDDGVILTVKNADGNVIGEAALSVNIKQN